MQIPEKFVAPPRLLMGPGPSDVAPSVLQAMAQPLVGHLDPVFVKMMEEIKTMLRTVFQTQNEMTFPVSGTGSAGMEFCFVNLVEPGDEAVSYTHLRAHETPEHLVCRLLLEKKNNSND